MKGQHRPVNHLNAHKHHSKHSASALLIAATLVGTLTACNTTSSGGNGTPPPGTTPSTPTVQLTNPTTTASLPTGFTATATATAPSGSTITEVDFYQADSTGANKVLIAKDTNGSDGWSAKYTGLTTGTTIQVIAQATGSNGAISTDATATVNVIPNPATTYWNNLWSGNPPTGVLVTTLGMTGTLSADSQWLLDFLQHEINLGMPVNTANMFTAEKIVYHTGATVPGIGADHTVRDDEKQWVHDYYQGMTNPAGGTYWDGLDTLKSKGLVANNIFVSPPSMGILALPSRGDPGMGLPNYQSTNAISPFPANANYGQFGMFDLNPDPNVVLSGLHAWNGFVGCDVAVDGKGISSYGELVNMNGYSDPSQVPLMPVRNMLPYDSTVIYTGTQSVPGTSYVDVTVDTFSDSQSKSLRIYPIDTWYVHNDADEPYAAVGDVVGPDSQLGVMSNERFAVQDDLSIWSPIGNTGVTLGDYGQTGTYKDYSFVDFLGFDVVHHPELYAGMRDPKFMLPLQTDTYGNITKADFNVLASDCGYTTPAMIWTSPLTTPMATYQNP